MGYGWLAVAGAAKGLNEGLDSIEEGKDRALKREYLRQSNERAAHADARAATAATEATETHGQATEAGRLKLDEAKHEKAYQDAAGRFVGSNGADTAALEKFHNEAFPDAPPAKLSRNDDGTYDLALGEQVMPNLTKEHVLGLFTYAQHPDQYMSMVTASNAKDREEKFKLMLEEKRSRARVEAARVRGAAAREKPSYQFDDEGNPWMFQGGSMTPVKAAGATGGLSAPAPTTAPTSPAVPDPDPTAPPASAWGLSGAPSLGPAPSVGVAPEIAPTTAPAGPAAGLSPRFKTKNAGKGGGSKMLQEIDTIASKLDDIPGETSNQKWLRAAGQRAAFVGKNDPQAAVRDYEKSVTAHMMKPGMTEEDAKAARTTIRQLVTDFASRYGHAASGGAGGGSDPLGILQ